MRRARPKTAKEPTIALINIVFLMLVFFMVAGTLAAPLSSDLKLIETADLDGREPPNALVLHQDGRMSYAGRDMASAADYLAERTDNQEGVVRLVPDRNLDAGKLLQISDDLRRAGAKSVMIVTERALQ